MLDCSIRTNYLTRDKVNSISHFGWMSWLGQSLHFSALHTRKAMRRIDWGMNGTLVSAWLSVVKSGSWLACWEGEIYCPTKPIVRICLTWNIPKLYPKISCTSQTHTHTHEPPIIQPLTDLTLCWHNLNKFWHRIYKIDRECMGMQWLPCLQRKSWH